MKKFELFMYTDRDCETGNYIGRTRTYEVMEENEDKAMARGYKENPWAKGCWCQEVRETETYGIAFNCKCYGHMMVRENSVLIKAKNKDQAIRFYNNEIKGKKFYAYKMNTIGEEGDIECGSIIKAYISCGYSEYDATNY